MKLLNLLTEVELENIDELIYKLVVQDDHVMQRLIETITIHETRWFRDKTFSKLVNEVLMPEWVDELRKNKLKNINIWSAAASSGQEIYSVIILISEYLIEHKITDIDLNRFNFFASDLSESVLEKAKAGCYSAYEVNRGCKDNVLERYFDLSGKNYCFKPEYRNLVKFKQQNLLEQIGFHQTFDYIMCRYVLIYFEKETKLDVIRRISEKLKHRGGLLLGGSEMYLEYAELFDKVNIGVGNYYIKK
jgi:chemotaxis protein methyltransferase CheR